MRGASYYAGLAFGILGLLIYAGVGMGIAVNAESNMRQQCPENRLSDGAVTFTMFAWPLMVAAYVTDRYVLGDNFIAPCKEAKP